MKVRNALFGSAAAIGMIAGGAGSAWAFDDVVWSWDKDVTETVTIDILVDADLEPTGLTQLEKLQIHVGDVTATSSVSNIRNNQPDPGSDGGAVMIEETFTFETIAEEDLDPEIQPAGPNDGTDLGNGIVAVFDGGNMEEGDGPDPTTLTFSISGEVDVPATDAGPMAARRFRRPVARNDR